MKTTRKAILTVQDNGLVIVEYYDTAGEKFYRETFEPQAICLIGRKMVHWVIKGTLL